MRLLIAIVAAFISVQAFACGRTQAEYVVKDFISAEFNRVEKVRTLKLGTLLLEDALVNDTNSALVHAVIETERYGRKIEEQVIVFKLDRFCNITSTQGATVQKVKLNNAF
jgi:hypothetical protein